MEISYRIFARAVDRAGNITPKPNSPDGYSYIEITLKTPKPVSSITTPGTGIPHFKPSPSPSLTGTAQYATGVEGEDS